MRYALATCVCALAMAAAAPAAAQFRAPQPLPAGEDYHAEVGLNFWSPDPELVIRFNGPQGIGDDIDFVQEFGIDTERFREFRATLKPGRKHKLRVDYVPIKYEAEAVIEREITFGGQTFTVGAPASTEVKWDLWKVGYEWDFVSGQSGFIGAVVDLKYSKVTAEITAAGFGSEATEANAPVPGIGGIARGYLSQYVSVTAEFTGFKMPDSFSEEIEGKFFDFDLYGTVNLGRNVGAQVGYRSITVDYAKDEDAGDLTMKGPYFGGVVRF